MRYNGGAVRSCSSFADPDPKNSQRFKEKLALNRWIKGTAQKGRFLREKRLSNAQGRGICEANAGHAPRAMVC
jgi:hypothetical protein